MYESEMHVQATNTYQKRRRRAISGAAQEQVNRKIFEFWFSCQSKSYVMRPALERKVCLGRG